MHISQHFLDNLIRIIQVATVEMIIMIRFTSSSCNMNKMSI